MCERKRDGGVVVGLVAAGNLIKIYFYLSMTNYLSLAQVGVA